jgi:uncharacterized protein (TIGR02594 family)
LLQYESDHLSCDDHLFELPGGQHLGVALGSIAYVALMKKRHLILALLLASSPATARPQLLTQGDARPLVRAALQFLGGNPTGMAHDWCARFVSIVLRRTGHRPLPNDMAQSALAYGPHTRSPKPGDLIVMRRHVGIYEGRDRHGIHMVSGNWGHRVARGVISPREVVAYIVVMQ